jgi:hypothetical protein
MCVEIVGRLAIEPCGAQRPAVVTGSLEPLHQDSHAVRGAARVIRVGIMNGEKNLHESFSGQVDYR